MVDGLVSVITPLYQAERYIRETIASVRNQSYENWEMIIVDDCSTDQSASIVAEEVKRDSRIRYYKNDTNQGVARSRNVAIERAQGRYLAFLDSDDIWEKNKLEKQVTYMEQNRIGFCYSACKVIDERGNDTGRVRHVPERVNYKQLLKGNCIPCLTVVIDRKQAGIVKMPDIHHEDYATWLNLLKRMGWAYGVTDVLASYRLCETSLSKNKVRAMKWTWDIYRKNQNLTLGMCCKCFAHYIWNAVLKRV